jgi:hypothetical protein
MLLSFWGYNSCLLMKVFVTILQEYPMLNVMKEEERFLE